LNGAPLLRPDALRYDGADLSEPQYQPLTISFFMRPFFTLGGVWAVMLVQVLITAYVMVLFVKHVLPDSGVGTMVFTAASSFSMFYAIFIMADIWTLCLFLLLFVIYRSGEIGWFDVSIFIFCTAAHNANFILGLGAVVLINLLYGLKIRRMTLILAAVAIAFLLQTLLEFVFYPDTDHMRFGFPGNQILVRAPEILKAKCVSDPDFVFCTEPIAEFISQSSASAGQLLWEESSLFNWNSALGEERLTLTAYEQASKELVLYTMRKPLSLGRFALEMTVENLHTNPLSIFGFPRDWADFFQHRYGEQWIFFERSLQYRNVWIQPYIKQMAVWIVITVWFLAGITLFQSLIEKDGNLFKLCVYAFLCVIGNAALMGALSDSVPRYHNRVFFLIGVLATISITQFVQQIHYWVRKKS
jgi:hypothetical protein